LAVTPHSEAPLDNSGSERLPVRRRRTLRGGRHRGAESFVLPPGCSPLILAVPGAYSPAGTAGALAALTEHTHTRCPVRLGQLVGPEAALGRALAEAAVTERDPDMPPAVVVPLLAGPDPRIERAISAAIAGSGVPAVQAAPLGPHPLVAQALHERLAEAGLARADRIRMMTTVTEAGGIVIVAPGGPVGVREAEVTAVLLASRLAVQASVATLEPMHGMPGPVEAAARLRASGAMHVAFAPNLIGPEVDPAYLSMLSKLAAESGAGLAAPLGAHPALSELIALRYVEALERALRGTFTQ
jgi:hypothetical protein